MFRLSTFRWIYEKVVSVAHLSYNAPGFSCREISLRVEKNNYSPQDWNIARLTSLLQIAQLVQTTWIHKGIVQPIHNQSEFTPINQLCPEFGCTSLQNRRVLLVFSLSLIRSVERPKLNAIKSFLKYLSKIKFTIINTEGELGNVNKPIGSNKIQRKPGSINESIDSRINISPIKWQWSSRRMHYTQIPRMIWKICILQSSFSFSFITMDS